LLIGFAPHHFVIFSDQSFTPSYFVFGEKSLYLSLSPSLSVLTWLLMAERVVGHGSFGVVFQVSLVYPPYLIALNLGRFDVN
jgi:hypothetical protein